MKRFYLLGITILFLTFQPCFANMDAINDALAREDYAATAALFQKLAEQGDKKAQAHLGYMYYVGEGVTQDYVEAIKWYKKAAILGDRDSQYNLAVVYAFGKGTKQDYKEALHWYRRAAEQGHKVAQYSLGISYAHGEGTDQDQKLAIKWFTKSANQGYVVAQNALINIEKTVTDASKRSLIDESRVNTPETDDLPKKGFFDRLFGKKDEADSNLESNDEAVKQSIGEHTEAAVSTTKIQELEADPVEIETRLSEGLVEPESGVTDEALKTIETATQDQAEKKGFLSWLFSSIEIFGSEGSDAEENTATDITKANTLTEPTVIAKIDRSEQSKEDGQSPESTQNYFGDLMDNSTQNFIEDRSGKTFTDPIEFIFNVENINDALNLRPLATKGNSIAQLKLGILYHQGKGVQQDSAQAFLWYRRAAEQGLADAQYNLGNMYLLGENVKQDDAKAQQWHEKAAKQGHQDAQYSLESLRNIVTAEAEQDDKAKEKIGFFDKLFRQDESDKEQPSALDGAGKKINESETRGSEATHYSPVNLYARGLVFELGVGVLQNYKTAFEFFKQAANLNHAPAQYKLGIAYAYGQGTKKDPVSAHVQYKKSAEQGYVLAQRTLAELYVSGEGVEQNKPLALVWYDILADSGNVMDIYRRDALKEKLTENEINEANILKQKLAN